MSSRSRPSTPWTNSVEEDSHFMNQRLRVSRENSVEEVDPVVLAELLARRASGLSEAPEADNEQNKPETRSWKQRLGFLTPAERSRNREAEKLQQLENNASLHKFSTKLRDFESNKLLKAIFPQVAESGEIAITTWSCDLCVNDGFKMKTGRMIVTPACLCFAVEKRNGHYSRILLLFQRIESVTHCVGKSDQILVLDSNGNNYVFSQLRKPLVVKHVLTHLMNHSDQVAFDRAARKHRSKSAPAPSVGVATVSTPGGSSYRASTAVYDPRSNGDHFAYRTPLTTPCIPRAPSFAMRNSSAPMTPGSLADSIQLQYHQQHGYGSSMTPILRSSSADCMSNAGSSFCGSWSMSTSKIDPCDLEIQMLHQQDQLMLGETPTSSVPATPPATLDSIFSPRPGSSNSTPCSSASAPPAFPQENSSIDPTSFKRAAQLVLERNQQSSKPKVSPVSHLRAPQFSPMQPEASGGNQSTGSMMSAMVDDMLRSDDGNGKQTKSTGSNSNSKEEKKEGKKPEKGFWSNLFSSKKKSEAEEEVKLESPSSERGELVKDNKETVAAHGISVLTLNELFENSDQQESNDDNERQQYAELRTPGSSSATSNTPHTSDILENIQYTPSSNSSASNMQIHTDGSLYEMQYRTPHSMMGRRTAHEDADQQQQHSNESLELGTVPRRRSKRTSRLRNMFGSSSSSSSFAPNDDQGQGDSNRWGISRSGLKSTSADSEGSPAFMPDQQQSQFQQDMSVAGLDAVQNLRILALRNLADSNKSLNQCMKAASLCSESAAGSLNSLNAQEEKIFAMNRDLDRIQVDSETGRKVALSMTSIFRWLPGKDAAKRHDKLMKMRAREDAERKRQAEIIIASNKMQRQLQGSGLSRLFSSSKPPLASKSGLSSASASSPPAVSAVKKSAVPTDITIQVLLLRNSDYTPANVTMIDGNGKFNPEYFTVTLQQPDSIYSLIDPKGAAIGSPKGPEPFAADQAISASSSVSRSSPSSLVSPGKKQQKQQRAEVAAATGSPSLAAMTGRFALSRVKFVRLHERPYHFTIFFKEGHEPPVIEGMAIRGPELAFRLASGKLDTRSSFKTMVQKGRELPVSIEDLARLWFVEYVPPAQEEEDSAIAAAERSELLGRTGESSASSNDPNSQVRQEIAVQDTQLVSLSKTLGGLKEMGTAMGDTLARQNQSLQKVETSVDKSADKIKRAVKHTNKML